MSEIVTIVAVAAALWQVRRIARAAAWLGDRWAVFVRRHDPRRRPIAQIAASARRLGRRYYYPPAGQRFAKAEGIRRAYDATLGEACDALGLTHLLGVLRAGDELDVERRRVEWELECAGLELGLPSPR